MAQKGVHKLRIVMAGPLPPAVGGMATVIGDVSQSRLSKAVDLELFDTAKSTPEGRSLWQALRARFDIWRHWWQLMNRGGRTIAHVHTCSGLTYFLDGALVVLAKMSGRRAVLHIHGARFDQFLAGLAAPTRWLVQWLARRANRVVVLSEAWRETLTPWLPEARLVVIPNGVPVPPAAARGGYKGDRIDILFLGNLCQRKGVWELVEAAEHLSSPHARIVLVGGEEDPGIGEELRKAVVSRGLLDRVKLMGPVYGEGKYDYLREADIFVLPSHAEGLPISLLEAMMAGLPVVVTPVGAVPSVVNHGEEGLVVPVGEPAALADALNRLIDDPDLRQRLGRAAREHSAAAYGIDRVANDYINLYKDIMANG